MILTLLDIVTVGTGLVGSVLVVAYILPRTTQLWSIGKLHDLRDELYRRAVANRWLLQTHSYRCTEMLITASIHLSRDYKYPGPGLQWAFQKPKELSPARDQEMQEHLFRDKAIGGGSEEAERLLCWVAELGLKARVPVVVRVIGGHPFSFLASLAVLPLAAVLATGAAIYHLVTKAQTGLLEYLRWWKRLLLSRRDGDTTGPVRQGGAEAVHQELYGMLAAAPHELCPPPPRPEGIAPQRAEY